MTLVIAKDDGGQNKGDYLSKDDIMFTLDQEEAIFGDEFLMTPIEKWKTSIPYTLSNTLSNTAISSIRIALAEMARKTCVSFRPKTQQDADSLNFVNVENKCWSYIGRLGGEQKISVGNGCTSKGKIKHLVMHALGFWHEHSREDRDKSIVINKDNIRPGNVDFFSKQKKLSSTKFPYDYQSIMHYSRNIFAVSGKLSMRMKFNVDKEIGHGNFLTNFDIGRINLLMCPQARETMPSFTSFKKEVAEFMKSNQKYSHSDFRGLLLAHLKKHYPIYYFSVHVYNPVYGWDAHTFGGRCMSAFRTYGRNIMVCGAKMSSKIPSKSKMDEIRAGVRAAVLNKSCYARKSWDYANKKVITYGYPILGILSIPHGNGLRSTWSGANTLFENYNCSGSDKSSIVIVFGQ